VRRKGCDEAYGVQGGGRGAVRSGGYREEERGVELVHQQVGREKGVGGVEVRGVVRE